MLKVRVVSVHRIGGHGTHACFGAVGRVLSALKDAKMENNTIVVFFGDHGYQLGDNDEVSLCAESERRALHCLTVCVADTVTSLDAPSGPSKLASSTQLEFLL